MKVPSVRGRKRKTGNRRSGTGEVNDSAPVTGRDSLSQGEEKGRGEGGGRGTEGGGGTCGGGGGGVEAKGHLGGNKSRDEQCSYPAWGESIL